MSDTWEYHDVHLYRVSTRSGEQAHVVAEHFLDVFKAQLIQEALSADGVLDEELMPLTIELVPPDEDLGVTCDDPPEDLPMPEDARLNGDMVIAPAAAWANLHERSAPHVVCSTLWEP